MYRRQMRMSHSQPQTPGLIINSRVIQHLAQFPAVFMAWNIATGTYQLLKTSNKFLNTSLSSLEKAAVYIAKKAEPVIQRFEPQIKTVDDIALRGLEKLEKTTSAITSQPEKIIRYTKNKYNEIVESGLQKYEDVKTTTLSTARDVGDAGRLHSSEFLNSPTGELLVMALNSAFDAYEMYLDKILPPLGDEGPVHAFGDREKLPVLARADALTERFKERFYKHSLLQLQNFQIRSKLTLYKLYQTNLLQLHFQNL